MVAKRIIKKKAEDSTGFVLLATSGLLLLISAVSSYMLISEKDTKLKTLEGVQNDTKSASEGLNATKKKMSDISRLTGWVAKSISVIQDAEKPVTSTTPGYRELWTSRSDLEGFVESWAQKLTEVYQVTKYGLRNKPEDEAKPKLNTQLLTAELDAITKSNLEKASTLVNARNTSWQETEKIVGTQEERGALAKLIEEKDVEINKCRGELAVLERRIKDVMEQGEKDVFDLQESLNQSNEEVTKVMRNQEEIMAKLLKEKAEYNDRLDKLRKRLELVREGVEIDGQITFSDAPNGYVYVDLGKNDAITENMEFDVFIIEKHGSPKNKGKVKVIKIYDKFSQASIVEGSMDIHSPIATGDYINSAVYNRKKAKIFVLCGSPIGRYSFSELRHKIEEFGGKVLVDITPEITYVVAGDNYDKDENYKKAMHLGAVVLREKELYALLNLAWQ